MKGILPDILDLEGPLIGNPRSGGITPVSTSPSTAGACMETGGANEMITMRM